MSAYPTGTVFPVNGRPHLGTMCARRRMIRRNFRAQTVLCYEAGAYQLRGRNGQLACISTPYGLVPIRVCQKHLVDYLKSYAPGTLTPERAIDEVRGN